MDLEDGDIFEGLIQGTEDTTPTGSSTPTATKATRVRVMADGERRLRKNSNAPTPGGAIDCAMPDIHEHCRVDETSTFMPFFPPGRLIHLRVQKNNR